jgi:hypothetical protein
MMNIRRPLRFENIADGKLEQQITQRGGVEYIGVEQAGVKSWADVAHIIRLCLGC